MAEMRLLLVVTKGDENPDELASKYDYKEHMHEHCILTLSEAEEHKQRDIERLCGLLDSCPYNMSEGDRIRVVNRLKQLRRMATEQYFDETTKGCTHKDGKAYTSDNFLGRYSYAKCYQSTLEETGVEAVFSSPFILLDGSKSYRAKKSDIDWSMMHMANTYINGRLWDIFVDGDTPNGDREKEAVDSMFMCSRQYFEQFSDKEEFVVHNSAFFTWGIISTDGTACFRKKSDDPYQWESGFFERFIEPLDDDAILSIYEVSI